MFFIEAEKDINDKCDDRAYKKRSRSRKKLSNESYKRIPVMYGKVGKEDGDAYDHNAWKLFLFSFCIHRRDFSTKQFIGQNRKGVFIR